MATMMVATCTLLLTVIVSSLPHPSHYASLSRHYRLLDADANGVVSLAEAAEGYTTVGSTPREWRVLPESSPDWLSLAQFSCGKRWSSRAEIDPAGFVDCIAFRSRAMLFTEASPPPSSPLPFQRAFGWWITDVRLDANNTNFTSSSQQEPDAHGLAPRLRGSGVSSALILISSDWHIEPWYAGDALASPQPWYTDGTVRFLDAGLTNMMSCADGATGTHSLPCNLTGKSDPPIEHIMTHFDAFRRLRRNTSTSAPDSFFFGGDTQAHKMNWTMRGKPEYGNFSHDYHFVPAITTLMKTVFAAVLPRFSAEHVYWAAGNHDGPEDQTFKSTTDEGVLSASLAWGNVLVESGIVTNQLGRRYDNDTNVLGGRKFDQVQFFLQTGYYMKRFAALPDANLFVICTNTNLGHSNVRQNNALYADLEWIAAQGGAVYLIGHHPQIIGCLNEKGVHACGYDRWIPARYRHLIRGIFSGHIHSHAPTNMTNYFTQVGSVDQAGDDTFYIASITHAADYHAVIDSTHGTLVAHERAPGMPNESLWHKTQITPPTPVPGATGAN